MNVSDDTKFETLYDHYKDTFVYIREYLKLRDRLFIFVLIVLTAMFLLIASPTNFFDAVSQIVKEKLGVKISVNQDFINSMLWFVLLIMVIRYYQNSTTLERQYTYIHKIEDDLCAIAGTDFIRREGKSYLNNYPLYSKWLSFLYTIFFPSLLLILTAVKIVMEFRTRTSNFALDLIVNILFCSMIWLSTILYHIWYRIKQ